METVVRLELERRGASVTYVRTGTGCEVDFLARDAEGGERLIQVCAEMDDPAVSEREFRALLEAAREHPRASVHVVTLPAEPPPQAPPGVNVHWAAGWLLQE